MTNNENIVPLKMEMKNNSDVVDGACSNVKFDEEKDKNDVSSVSCVILSKRALLTFKLLLS